MVSLETLRARVAKKQSRNCLHGARLSSGSCPRKSKATGKARKQRECGFGARLSTGKCPRRKRVGKRTRGFNMDEIYGKDRY